MSTVTIEAVIAQALQMSAEDRALIAERLLSSLDAEVDPDAEAAWREEVQRRIEEIESGKVECISWEETRRRLAGNAHAKR
jgi:putative addiction module component (TIGR02574 family)